MDREKSLFARRIPTLFGVLVIAVGIAVTVYLAQQQQDIRQRALGTGGLTFVDAAEGQISSTANQTVRVKLTYNPTGSQNPTATPTLTGSPTPTPTTGQNPTFTPTPGTQQACTIAGPATITAGAQYSLTGETAISCNTSAYAGFGTCLWGLLNAKPGGFSVYFEDALASSKNTVTISTADLAGLAAGTYQMFFIRNYGGPTLPALVCVKTVTL